MMNQAANTIIKISNMRSIVRPRTFIDFIHPFLLFIIKVKEKLVNVSVPANRHKVCRN